MAKYVDPTNMVMLLVGNKSDLKQRSVTPEEGRKLAEEEGFFFIETSAKDAVNVDRAFYIVTRQILLKAMGQKGITSLKDRKKRASLMVDGVEIGGEDEKKSSNCAC